MSPNKPSYFSHIRTNVGKSYDWYSKPATFWVHFFGFNERYFVISRNAGPPLGKAALSGLKRDLWSVNWLLASNLQAASAITIHSKCERNHALEPNRHRHLKRGGKTRWRCSHTHWYSLPTLNSQDSELLNPRFAEQECKLEKAQEISWLISIKRNKRWNIKTFIEVFQCPP